jgi:CHAT domain
MTSAPDPPDSLPPTIRLTVLIQGAHYSLIATSHTGDELEFSSLGTVAQLGTIRVQLGRQIEMFKNAVNRQLDLRNDRARIDRSMRVLNQIGQWLLAAFLRRGRTRDPGIQELCRAALLEWPRDVHPPIVEVTGDTDTIFPVEFLPLFAEESGRTIETNEDLRAVAEGFAGFAGVVYRTLATHSCRKVDPSAQELLLNGKKLPVKLFYHARLVGAQKEAQFLGSLRAAGLVDLEGPWPDDSLTEESVLQTLNKNLNDPALSLKGIRRPFADQVQHFACHCDCLLPDEPVTDDDVNEFPRIRFAGPKKSDIPIRQFDLLQKYMDERRSFPKLQSLPLVFMNACDSSRIDPNTSASFAEYFLDQGNLGFIGTESAVPDLVAAEFSRYFYTELLRGRSLGEALWRARHMLLERRSNPLGLLYTLYANPYIVARAGGSGDHPVV